MNTSAGIVLLTGERRIEVDSVQEGQIQIADDSQNVAVAVRAREAQRVAAEIPEHGGPAHRHEALDHDGQDVFAADQAAVEERQARRHQHDEAGARGS